MGIIAQLRFTALALDLRSLRSRTPYGVPVPWRLATAGGAPQSGLSLLAVPPLAMASGFYHHGALLHLAISAFDGLHWDT